jgi:hypothetical protein
MTDFEKLLAEQALASSEHTTELLRQLLTVPPPPPPPPPPGELPPDDPMPMDPASVLEMQSLMALPAEFRNEGVLRFSRSGVAHVHTADTVVNFGLIDAGTDADPMVGTLTWTVADTGPIANLLGRGIISVGRFYACGKLVGDGSTVVFRSENTALDRRGDVKLMHNPHHSVCHCVFFNLGRTDKSKLISATNPRGHYALHFHRCGLDKSLPPIMCEGNIVIGSPGWGIVNHSSNVAIVGNRVSKINGAGIVTEAGDEIGEITRNVIEDITGTPGFFATRQTNFDFGFQGDGIWLQGPGVVIRDNTIRRCANSGIVCAPLRMPDPNVPGPSSTIMFPVPNLPDPSAVPEGTIFVKPALVPLRIFGGLIEDCGSAGLETWFLGDQDNPNNPKLLSIVDGLKIRRTGIRGVNYHYQKFISFRGVDIDQTQTGFERNYGSMSAEFDACRVTNAKVGIMTPSQGRNVVKGCRIDAEVGITIPHGSAFRHLDIAADNVFGPDCKVQVLVEDPTEDPSQPTPVTGYPSVPQNTQERHVPQSYNGWKLSPFERVDKKELWKVFRRDAYTGWYDNLTWGGKQVFSRLAALDFVPVPAGYGVPELDGKTGRQLFEQYGLAVWGIPASDDAVLQGGGCLVGTPRDWPLVHFESPHVTSSENYRVLVRARGPDSNLAGGPYIWDFSMTLKPGLNVVTFLDQQGRLRSELVFRQ